MTTPVRSSSLTTRGPLLTRRRLINGAATLAGAAAAGGFATTPACATDLRDQGLITSVKDQDFPVACNSCTAFAVVATIEGTYNKTHPGSGPAGPDFDEIDLFTNAGPSTGCATTHWWPKNALAYCQGTGLAWEGMPTKPRVKVTPKNLLRATPNQTQAAMKNHIDSIGPVIAVMVQYEDFYLFGDFWAQQNPTNTRNPNVYSPGTFAPGRHRRPGPVVGGHVVSIVGYNHNDSWICKNSWGDAWNGDGYVLIAQGRGVNAECYIDLIDVWGVEAIP
jgi:hypothetical protein